MTKDYFRSTAHQGEQALAQIMQKQNRIEYLRDSDAKRSKHHEIKCTNCGTSGHNERSCVSECKHYEFVPFKNYLIILDGRKYPHCEKETALWGHQWELNLAWGSWRTSYQLGTYYLLGAEIQLTKTHWRIPQWCVLLCHTKITLSLPLVMYFTT